jgi:hypothetical protein
MSNEQLDAALDARFKARVSELQAEFGVDYAHAVRLFAVELLTMSEAKWGTQFVIDMLERQLAKMARERKPN